MQSGEASRLHSSPLPLPHPYTGPYSLHHNTNETVSPRYVTSSLVDYPLNETSNIVMCQRGSTNHDPSVAYLLLHSH